MFRRSEQQNRRISSNRSKTVNPLERRFLVLVGSVLLAMAVTACGDDPPPQDPITGGNNGDADATVSDAGDTSGDDAETDDVADDDGTTDDATDGANDGETEGDGGDTGDSSDTGDDGDTGTQTCETGDCDSGELCVEGSCVAETPQTKCQTADDIGVLPMNTQTTISDSLLERHPHDGMWGAGAEFRGRRASLQVQRGRARGARLQRQLGRPIRRAARLSHGGLP
jgi:hypothetical protein